MDDVSESWMHEGADPCRLLGFGGRKGQEPRGRGKQLLSEYGVGFDKSLCSIELRDGPLPHSRTVGEWLVD